MGDSSLRKAIESQKLRVVTLPFVNPDEHSFEHLTEHISLNLRLVPPPSSGLNLELNLDCDSEQDAKPAAQYRQEHRQKTHRPILFASSRSIQQSVVILALRIQS